MKSGGLEVNSLWSSTQSVVVMGFTVNCLLSWIWKLNLLLLVECSKGALAPKYSWFWRGFHVLRGFFRLQVYPLRGWAHIDFGVGKRLILDEFT